MEHLEKINCLRLTRDQVALIVFLAVASWFFFSFWTMRTEESPNPKVLSIYWGFPFETIKFKNAEILYHGTPTEEGPMIPARARNVTIDEYFSVGIILDAIIYLAFSTIALKLGIWIHDEMAYRRHNES